MSSNQKLTSQLSKYINSSKDKELFDIIVELTPQTDEAKINKSLSRQEKIIIMQKDFAKQSEPVESTITDAGGEVVGRAWINKTIKARVPAKSLKDISEHEDVLSVDIPNQLNED